MPHLQKKIESVMNSSGKSPAPSLAFLLHGISIFYGAVQKLRYFCYRQRIFPSRKLPCKVISIGNITVGGTGKTPMTIYVAEELRRAGFKVVIVSRGYRGEAEKRGGIVGDGRTMYMDASQAGDEPYMMACRLTDIPVVVGKNRFAAGLLAINRFQPDVIVLDDAFQHLKLQRDIDLVLLDHSRPFGNSYLLPRGGLREPRSTLSRSTACILTRCKTEADEALISSIAEIKRLAPGIPVFTSSHVPYWYKIQGEGNTSPAATSTVSSGNEIGQMKQRKVFCFSGIARNEDFQHAVKGLGFEVTGLLEFPDHHPYTEKDLAAILQRAGDTGADRLITTEKDYARIDVKDPFPLELIVVGVNVSFGDNDQAFRSFILEWVKQARDRADQSSAMK